MRTGFQGSSSSGGETVCLSLHRPSRVGHCCSLALDVGASRSDVPRRDKKFRKPISLRYRGTRHSFTVRSHDSRVWSMMQRYCVCAQELMLYIDVLFVIKADSLDSLALGLPGYGIPHKYIGQHTTCCLGNTPNNMHARV